jgi:hypothetical protein
VKRSFAFFLSAALACTPAWGQSTALIGVHNGAPAAGGGGGCVSNCMVTPIMQVQIGVSLTSTPTYSGFVAGPPNAALNTRQMPMAIAGKVSALRVSGASITTNFVTYGLNVNGVLSALQCSVGTGGGVNPGNTTSCVDNNSADIPTLNPGDLVVWQSYAPGGAATGTGGALSALFTSTVGQESLFGATTQSWSAAAIGYSAPSTGAPLQTTEYVASDIMPAPVTIDRLRAFFTTSLGTNKLEMSAFKNGVKTLLDVTCTGSTTCVENTDSVSFAAGDTFSVQLCPGGVAGCPAGTASSGNFANYSFRSVPATPNQAVIFTNSVAAFPGNNVSNTFGALGGGAYTLGGETQTNNRNIMPTLPVTATFGNLWVAQCPGPDSTGAGGVTRTFAARLNGVSQTLAISMPGTAINACPTLTVAHDSAHTFTTTTPDLVGTLTTLNTTTNGVTVSAFKTGATVTVP